MASPDRSIPDRRSVREAENLFLDLRPRLEGVLRRYDIPSEDAAHLLEETALGLIYKGDQLENRNLERWLVARLTHQCRSYWVTRKRLVERAVSKLFNSPVS